LKVVLRERGLKHPEVRYGVITNIVKAPEKGDGWPATLEDLAGHINNRVLTGPPWNDQGSVHKKYEDGSVSLVLNGAAVMLAELPDSEAIADKVVDPLLEIYAKSGRD
jgi:hypothetical protein